MPKYLSVNQRTIIEMLADEMGDQNAKRVMNLGKYKEDAPSSSGSGKDHENEGWLKNAWHNITGQHDDIDQAKGQQKKSSEGEQDEEPKKASGSGSG